MSYAHLKFVKLDPNATIPRKATSGTELEHQDAAFDLFPSINTTIVPGERALIPTGLSAIIPAGYWVKFHERSGLAAKNGIHIMGGVIDNTYLGEWKVVMYNSGSSTLSISVDKAISQFTVEKLNWTQISEVTRDEFNEEFHRRTDERKDKGFGSTDKK